MYSDLRQVTHELTKFIIFSTSFILKIVHNHVKMEEETLHYFHFWHERCNT